MKDVKNSNSNNNHNDKNFQSNNNKNDQSADSSKKLTDNNTKEDKLEVTKDNNQKSKSLFDDDFNIDDMDIEIDAELEAEIAK